VVSTLSLKRPALPRPVGAALAFALALAAAVRREAARLADGVGKVLAQERAQFRKINDALIERIAVLEAAPRAAPNDAGGVVLDLPAERLRRSGEK
jgi:hypothetical protein